jgi:hypothetical protein
MEKSSYLTLQQCNRNTNRLTKEDFGPLFLWKILSVELGFTEKVPIYSKAIL